MLHLVALYVTIAILVLFLGTKQEENLDKACIAAMVLVGVFAAMSVIMLHGTPFFPLGAFSTAVLLLLHHTIIHYKSEFPGERCSCAPFQCKDVGNHETWIVASVTAGVVSLFQI
jgi:hypothetical protein